MLFQTKNKLNPRIVIAITISIILVNCSNKKEEFENMELVYKTQELNLGHYIITIPFSWQKLSDGRIMKYLTSEKDTIIINLGPTSPKYMEGFMTKEIGDSIFLVDQKNHSKLEFVSLKKDYTPQKADKVERKNLLINNLRAAISVTKTTGIGVTEMSIQEDKKNNVKKIDIYGENLKRNSEYELIHAFKTLRKNE